MTSISADRISPPSSGSVTIATGLLFLWLFWPSGAALFDLWVSGIDVDQGLLLAPLAGYMLWQKGLSVDRRPQRLAGIVLLSLFVLLRIVSEVAADHYSLRLSMLGAAVSLIVFSYGFRQIRHWWLPLLLLLVAMPLPNPVWTRLAFPLQLGAAHIAASLLSMRDIPVELAGTVIQMPGRLVLVTEGCSGLRSMMTICTVAVILVQMTLRSAWAGAAVVAGMIPVSFALNCIRIFITSFLVYFLAPSWGEGAAHFTLGWSLFVINVGLLIATVRFVERLERRRYRSRVPAT